MIAIGFVFGMLGFMFGIIAYSRVGALEKKLKALGVLDPEFTSEE